VSRRTKAIAKQCAEHITLTFIAHPEYRGPNFAGTKFPDFAAGYVRDQLYLLTGIKKPTDIEYREADEIARSISEKVLKQRGLIQW
jgi:hypothetical protein